VSREQFQKWYDTLSQDDRIRVMRLIVAEDIDDGLPTEDPLMKKARENIYNKFYERDMQ
jgi:hypothetical protein